MAKIDKDKWLKHALRMRYLIAKSDGVILRAVSHDKLTGKPTSTEYRVVTQQTHKPTGRVYINMTYMGITKSLLVNRIIAWAFHPNPDDLPQVNHKDGVKANNSKDNLEWASASENEKHAHRTGLKSGRGSQNSNAKLTANDVLEIRASSETPTEIARRYGVSRSTIVNIIRRNSWQHV